MTSLIDSHDYLAEDISAADDLEVGSPSKCLTPKNYCTIQYRRYSNIRFQITKSMDRRLGKVFKLMLTSWRSKPTKSAQSIILKKST